MPFVYPNRPHVRKHGPAGYTDFTSFKPWLRDEFHFRCVYCLHRERWYPSGHAAFGVEHVRPKGNPRNAAILCDYENLVYACNSCNSNKRDELSLNPCAMAFADHLRVADNGSISGLTEEGREMVELLGLNETWQQRTRQRYLLIGRRFEERPKDPDIRALYLDYFGYPDDLPNLDALRPASNSRPAGLAEACFRQRREGRLAETYC